MFKALNGILGTALLLFVCAHSSGALAQAGKRISSSLLLLIDASGSMGDEVGGGHSQAKIDAAKEAATAALGRAAGRGSVEIAVLAFSGGCSNPVPRHQTFTRDIDRLTAFIDSLQPGGGTPMADALLFANRFMDRNGHSGASDQMIMLLADGQNDCGDVSQSLATLKASGIVFRHETVGFGITPNSPAARDLREVATQTGGTYHHAADATQLADVFMEFVNTFTVIDLLGQFGTNASAPSPLPSPNADRQTGKDQGGLDGLLGRFKASPKGDRQEEKKKKKKEKENEGYFMSVATDESRGAYGFGWSDEWTTNADSEAIKACRSTGGFQCMPRSGGSVISHRNGCAAVARGRAELVDHEGNHSADITLVGDVSGAVTSARESAERTALRSCEVALTAGRYRGEVPDDGSIRMGDAVLSHQCGIVATMCSSDVAAAPHP